MTTELAEPSPMLWWKQFNDPVLDALLQEAGSNNRDLAAAVARIDQAKALRGVAASAQLPQLDGSMSAGRTRYSTQSSFGSSIGTRNQFAASLDASWEPDLFGRIRRSIEAADARVDAEVAARDGIELTVLAETASAYFELRSLQSQLANLDQMIGLLREVESIAGAQLELGIISEYELLQATSERQNLEAQLPGINAEVAIRMHRLAVLTGKPPEQHIAMLTAPAALPTPVDRVPVGLRSTILERRPDVRLAERRLAASSADIGVATAAMFPDFSLTGVVGTTARLFGDLFTAGTITSSVSGALNWPIFSAGRITSQIKAAEAAEREALVQYEQQLLLALEDTENALLRYGQEWKTLSRLTTVVDNRQNAFDIARIRYETGQESFLAMVEAERQLNSARTAMIQSHERLLLRLTTLYKTLGGEWITPDK